MSGADLVTAAAGTAVTLLLFCSLFLAIFWTPGVLLGLFALVYAADARSLSHAAPAERHADVVADPLRRYHGGWLDSPARPD